MDLARKDDYLLVAEYNNDRLRRVHIPTAEVTTLAGDGVDGTDDGLGTSARFNYPSGISVYEDLAFVADKVNNMIRTVTLADIPTNDASAPYFTIPVGRTGLAWGLGQNTAVDGGRDVATVNMPFSVAVSSDNQWLYTASYDSCHIRRTRLVDMVTDTLAGSGSCGAAVDGVGTNARFHKLYEITLSSDDRLLYVSDRLNSRIRIVDTLTASTSTFASSIGVGGVALSADDSTLYVTDTTAHQIWSYDTTTGAGSQIAGSTRGFAEGVGTSAKFDNPRALVVSADGNFLYIADDQNDRVRLLNLATKEVTTVVGNGAHATTDGFGTSASLFWPYGLALSDDYLYVSQQTANNLRRVRLADYYTDTLSGTGTNGYRNGDGSFAQFGATLGIALNPAKDTLYVCSSNHRVQYVNVVERDVRPASPVLPSDHPAGTGYGMLVVRGSYMSIEPVFSPFGRDWAIAMWIKIPASCDSGRGDTEFIFNRGHESDTNRQLRIMHNYGKLTFQIFNSGSDHRTYQTSAIYQDDVWHHVAWSVSALGEWFIAIDGVPQSHGVSSYPALEIGSGEVTYLGANHVPNHDKGCIRYADVRIMEQVLTQASVGKIYAERGVVATGTAVRGRAVTLGPAPVIWLPLDDEYVYASVDGIYSAVAMAFPDEAGHVLPYVAQLSDHPSGEGGVVHVQKGSYLSIDPVFSLFGRDWSISLWIKAPASCDDNRHDTEFIFNYGGSVNDDVLVRIYHQYGKITFLTHSSSGSVYHQTDALYQDDEWHHLTWSVTVAGSWFITIDGAEIAHGVTGHAIPEITAGEEVIHLGAAHIPNHDKSCFRYADFRVMDSVLTQADVDTIYAERGKIKIETAQADNGTIVGYTIEASPLFSIGGYGGGGASGCGNTPLQCLVPLAQTNVSGEGGSCHQADSPMCATFSRIGQYAGGGGGSVGDGAKASVNSNGQYHGGYGGQSMHDHL